MSLLEKLRRRNIFRVAAAYAVFSWVILQLLNVVAEPLNLPEFFVSTAIILLAIGLPIVMLLGWMLKLDAGGTQSTVGDSSSAGLVSSSRHYIETTLLALLAIGMIWLITKDLNSSDTSDNRALPVVVLMDTYAPRGVYDDETVLRNGTNADVLSNELAGLPVLLQKEGVGAIWDRESQIVNQQPAFVVIHRSAFFHSMNQELGFGYGDNPETFNKEAWTRLYDIADNKLIAFLGYVAGSVPDTQFIVYSRGTGGGWTDADYRAAWTHRAENRFEALTDRIHTFAVPGGIETGSFKKPEASEIVRKLIFDGLSQE